MTLSSLRLTNFRNYHNYHTDISPLTVLIGPNGIGKTNILESIVMLSTTKSHRTSRDRDLIQEGEETARVEGSIQHDTKTHSLAIGFSTNPAISKTYFKDGQVVKGTDLIGHIKTVLFSPETMELIYGPPAIRRRFLNSLLCQIDPHYLQSLWTYNKVVQERNRLLFLIGQQHSTAQELEFWNQKLIENGSFLINSRQKFIDFLGQHLKSLYHEVSGQTDNLSIQYEPSILPDQFFHALTTNYSREIKNCSTLFGPHRDDFQISLNHKTLATYGSRGEARSAILSLKLGEIQFHESSHHEKPILLLDDIFSELDQSRRQRLNEFVSQTQTIITSTELHDLNSKTLKTAQIITLTDKRGEDGGDDGK